MNQLEEYLKENYKNIDSNKLIDLFFKQENFYTLILPQPLPRNCEYLVQEIENDLVGLIFTSKEKIEEYKKLEPLVKNWQIKEYKTNTFEKYFEELPKIKGICINYGFYWGKLLLKE